MIDVIQIYKYKELFTKGSYTPKNRKDLEDFPDVIVSDLGYLSGNTLNFHPSAFAKLKYKSPDLLIIQDLLRRNQADSSLWLKKSREAFRNFRHEEFYEFLRPETIKSFELFKIKKNVEGFYELFLDYESNSAVIGIPQRQDHKISNLKIGEAVRFRINGKSDFTLTGRKERTFYEHDYLVVWEGQAEKIVQSSKSGIKNIPPENNKIDERKILG